MQIAMWAPLGKKWRRLFNTPQKITSVSKDVYHVELL